MWVYISLESSINIPHYLRIMTHDNIVTSSQLIYVSGPLWTASLVFTGSFDILVCMNAAAIVYTHCTGFLTCHSGRKYLYVWRSIKFNIKNKVECNTSLHSNPTRPISLRRRNVKSCSFFPRRQFPLIYLTLLHILTLPIFFNRPRFFITTVC